MGLSSSFLFAQMPGYFISSDNGEFRFIQRFVWTGGENALRYQVVFEREINGIYVSHLIEFTDQHYIEVSLPPGEYRIQVIPYDILDRPYRGSEWKYVQILPAPRPEFPGTLPDTEPEFQYIAEPDPQPEQIDEPFIPHTLVQEPEPDHDFVLRLPREPYLPPLGPVIFSAGLSWSPLFTVYGNEYINVTAILGIGARASFLFHTFYGFYVGIEATAHFSMEDEFHMPHYMNALSIETEEQEKYEVFSFSAGANLFVLKWLPGNRVALGFRFGFDYPITIGESARKRNSFNIDQFAPGFGLSARFRIVDNFILEAGADFSNIFFDSHIGYFKPWLCFGLQF
ncbi:MAG: hypothetical protein FWD24_08380 [Treponema sp.]|nr:hypothetical protein [Treponema sp.]